MATTKNVFGKTVEVRTKRVKAHSFAGGWNGFEFYVDSKGVEYAVDAMLGRKPFTISLERLLSE